MEKKSSIKLYIFIVFLVLLVPLWRMFIVENFKVLPSDFSYEADLLSIDNFYDETQNKFTGNQVTNSELSYKVLDDKDGVLLVENKFDVYTLEGSKIISIDRVLGVDPKSGRYLPEYGDKSRMGSMFAPISLKAGESFVYWHVNYDEPFEMKYVSEEYMDGLKLLKYETRRGDYLVDQTSALHHLDGVPMEKGVMTAPLLQVWVEPLTGSMVKFKDVSESYFFDIETDEYLHPWNNFSNEYTDTSVSKHVADAKLLKMKYQILDYVVPFAILAFVLALIILNIKAAMTENLSDERVLNLKNKGLVIGFLFVTSVMLYGIYYEYILLNVESQSDFKVGIVLLNETSTLKENVDAFESALASNGFIEGENLEIHRENALGDEITFIDIVRRYIKEEVDLIYTLTTPGVELVRSETSEVPIVFSVVTYPVKQGLIDSLEDSKNNLVGVKHTVPISGQWLEFKNILKVNPQVNFDKVVYVSSEGSEVNELRYLEFKNYFAGESIQTERLIADDRSDLQDKLAKLEGEYILYGGCDSFIQIEGDGLIKFANDNNRILMSCVSSLVPNGALFSKSVDFADVGEVAGDKASLILYGSETRWLKTVEPRKLVVSINSEAAENLNLEIPYETYPSLLTYPN